MPYDLTPAPSPRERGVIPHKEKDQVP